MIPVESTTAPLILVVEDEKNLAEGISENLRREGYAAEVVADGLTALDRIVAGDYSLVVLDVMLPCLDGYSVCEAVRSRGCRTPILFLTAKGGVDDRIRGLRAGGDDYLPKPFHLQEFLVRVAAILRRSQWTPAGAQSHERINFGANRFDVRSYEATAWDGTCHTLSDKEAMILKVLAERPREVVTREDILDWVWGYEVLPPTRVVDEIIGRLRARFEPDPQTPKHFHTVTGVGYRFEPEGGRA